MEIGVSIFRGISIERQAELFKKYGVKYTFTESEKENFDEVIECFQKNGIICETLHAPFDKINDMWKPGEDGEKMLARLTDAVDKCHKYNIPTVIIHISSGRPMTEITEYGIERYDRLMEYAGERNVKIAYENIRYMENVEFLMNRHKDAGFCWDNGHESCYTPGVPFMPSFGKRVIALHIHDNSGETDVDNHVLPFDGNIDFEEVAKHIADSGYNGSIMLEVSNLVSYKGEKIYEKLTDDEYVQRAVNSARKLADIVENYRK